MNCSDREKIRKQFMNLIWEIETKNFKENSDNEIVNLFDKFVKSKIISKSDNLDIRIALNKFYNVWLPILIRFKGDKNLLKTIKINEGTKFEKELVKKISKLWRKKIKGRDDKRIIMIIDDQKSKIINLRLKDFDKLNKNDRIELCKEITQEFLYHHFKKNISQENKSKPLPSLIDVLFEKKEKFTFNILPFGGHKNFAKLSKIFVDIEFDSELKSILFEFGMCIYFKKLKERSEIVDLKWMKLGSKNLNEKKNDWGCPLVILFFLNSNFSERVCKFLNSNSELVEDKSRNNRFKEFLKEFIDKNFCNEEYKIKFKKLIKKFFDYQKIKKKKRKKYSNKEFEKFWKNIEKLLISRGYELTIPDLLNNNQKTVEKSLTLVQKVRSSSPLESDQKEGVFSNSIQNKKQSSKDLPQTHTPINSKTGKKDSDTNQNNLEFSFNQFEDETLLKKRSENELVKEKKIDNLPENPDPKSKKVKT